jgi:hypothetical protein
MFLSENENIKCHFVRNKQLQGYYVLQLKLGCNAKKSSFFKRQ